MKRIGIVMALASALLVSAYSQAPQAGAVRKVQVTAQTIASQPAGKPLLIDLTRKGTVHEVAEGIDQSRVRVRTSTGEMALSEFLRESGKTVTGNFFVGTIDDLSALNFGFPGGGTTQPPRGGVSQVECQPATCDCIAGTDCIDLRKSKLCKGTIYCCRTCGTNGRRGCFCFTKTV